MLKKLEDLKFSEFKRVFMECLAVLFSQGVESEEQARFAKGLIDYIMMRVASCEELGLDNEMLPIFNISLWQGMTEKTMHDFQFKAYTLKCMERKEKLDNLKERIFQTIQEWGLETFNAPVTIREVDEMSDKMFQMGTWNTTKTKNREE